MNAPKLARFRAAAVQVMPAFDSREACVEKAASLIREAARNGANLVAFPESWVPGYPHAGWLALPCGIHVPAEALRRSLTRHHQNAVEIPSVTTDALGAAAKAAGVQVVIGLTERERERDYSTGTLYNTLLFLGADGSILGKHRKLVPTAGERVIWGRGDGSTLAVFDTPLGRIGGLACAEHVMPLARYALHAQGEQVHIAAWPYVDDQPTLMTRFHAYEGRTFAIGVGMPLAPHLVQSPDLQDEIRGLVQAMLDQAGPSFGSVVYGPGGQIVAGPFGGEEGILYADIDLESIAFDKMLFDVVGHYNRPDVFEVIVHTSPQRPIRFERGALAPAPAGGSARGGADL